MQNQDLKLNGYELVWSDEFDGDKLDRAKWNLNPHMCGREDLEVRTDESAVKVENGAVSLISGRIDDTHYYTNASLTTDDTMIFKYGYVEIRAKVPSLKPAYPSFWMKAKAGYRTDEDNMGEIDIFENFGETGKLSFACHNWWTGGHSSIGADTMAFDSREEAENWHTYGLRWTENALEYYIDGNLCNTFDISEETVGGKADLKSASFRDHYYLVMNNYVFTASYHFSTPERVATPEDMFPINYSIDYVRLYQKPGEGEVVIL